MMLWSFPRLLLELLKQCNCWSMRDCVLRSKLLGRPHKWESLYNGAEAKLGRMELRQLPAELVEHIREHAQARGTLTAVPARSLCAHLHGCPHKRLRRFRRPLAKSNRCLYPSDPR